MLVFKTWFSWIRGSDKIIIDNLVGDEPHITNKPAFISLANSSDQNPFGEIKPLITSGENLSNGYSFPGIPDGLGAVEIEMYL